MADLAGIRVALANTIMNNVVNQPGNPVLAATATLVGQINPPIAIVAPQPGQLLVFDTFEGGVTYHLRVVLAASLGDDLSAQNLLDSYLSVTEPGSVINAISNNPRLGGAAEYAWVTTAHSYGYRMWGDQQYFGTELLVSVMAT